MKNKTLLSLTASALILTTSLRANAFVFLGEAMITHLGHAILNCDCTIVPPPFCVPKCLTPWLDFNSPVTSWLDPALNVVTLLDAAATKKQQEKSVDAKEALQELNKALSPGCGGDNEEGDESSFSPTDNLVVAPDVVTELLDDADSLEQVRCAAENFLAESASCNQDCMVQRQNEWLLTSLALAVGASDKLLSVSDDMSGEYSKLLQDFGSQTGPKGMWGSSSKITLHTHVQQNDINALYARDLEINALNGVRETVKIKCEYSGGDDPCPNPARHRVQSISSGAYSWFCQQHAPKKN